ncbi:MAG: glycosyltransferase [Anaerolineae bacterium]|nr:glycosyltransferase [Anaerolineae bacterium]
MNNSVVIPVLNERENVAKLYCELATVLKAHSDKPCEVIFVDDGSSDGTSEVLEASHAQDARVKVIQLRRNFGKLAAILIVVSKPTTARLLRNVFVERTPLVYTCSGSSGRIAPGARACVELAA